MDGVAIAGPHELECSSQQWRSFQDYLPGSNASDASLKSSQMPAQKPMVRKLTKDIVETYKICNHQFKFSEDLNPKPSLTSPSIGVLNDGYDNVNSDLILKVNSDLINTKTKRRYIVKALLGHGTFGQVAKCWVPETNSFVALKVIKNLPAYHQQAQVEVSMLASLNQKFDPEDTHHIVRMRDCFVHQQHLCIGFELLDINLYEVIKLNQFRGLPLSLVQLFSKQILCGLALLKDASIIHCDLKPENIMLGPSGKKPVIKLIDLGSACMEGRTIYTYIQSRYYRSPEVVLGCKYTTAIDMWSFGCIVAELFLGLPLFPGSSEFDLLRRMIKILGQQPPDHLLKDAKHVDKFFKCVANVHSDNSESAIGNESSYRALTIEEFEARDSKRPCIGKEYFQSMNLETIVINYPYKKHLRPEEIIKESQARLGLIDFLKGVMEFDPAKRWSPLQASRHPFITGEPFICSYSPLPENHIPVDQSMKVEHHPNGGHWFPQGLSPNVSGLNRALFQNSSHIQTLPYNHSSSYGSIGSHGSYTDGYMLGSSYGSYGDGGNMFQYYSPVGPSGMHINPQNGGIPLLGNSPDARRRKPHYNPANGLGFSPSNFAPLPLGASPSQFTPPAHYGPPSPRSNSHGKFQSSSHFSRRKNWNHQGTPQFPECSSSYGDKFPPLIGNSPLNRQVFVNHNWIHQDAAEGSFLDKIENTQTLLDPGDWDPNYSDDQLLEECGAESRSLNMEFLKMVNLGLGNSPSTSQNCNWLVQRQNGPISSFNLGSPPSSLSKAPNFVPPGTHGPPIRTGQHPPRFSHGRGLVRIGEWNHTKIPPSGGSLSPGSGSFSNMPWGRRNNYPVANIPPSHGRKDYGRIS